MNACDAVRELLAAQALDALEDSQEALVAEHLAVCPACRALDAETREYLGFVAAPPLEPPPAVWERIRGRIDRERAGHEPVRLLPEAEESGEPSVISLSCSFCRGGLVRDESVYCASCLAPHHPDCFRAHGRCSVMGCGETRVVKPAESDADSRYAPPQRLDPKKRPARRRTRFWVAGGLGGALLGGLAAAALVEEERGLATPRGVPAVVPRAAPTPPPPAPAPRFDVRVKDASLGELAHTLQRVAAQHGDQTEVHVHPSLEDVLVRRGRWQGLTLVEIADVLADSLEGVQATTGAAFGQTPWVALAPSLLTGDAASYLERAGPRIPVDTTQAFTLQPRWEVSDLHTGYGQLVRPAPDGRAVVLVEGSQLRLFVGSEPADTCFLGQRVTDAEWVGDELVVRGVHEGRLASSRWRVVGGALVASQAASEDAAQAGEGDADPGDAERSAGRTAPDGRAVARGVADGVEVRAAAAEEPAARIPSPTPLGLAWSPDSETLAFWTRSQVHAVTDPLAWAAGQDTLLLELPGRQVRGVRWSGERLLITSRHSVRRAPLIRVEPWDGTRDARTLLLGEEEGGLRINPRWGERAPVAPSPAEPAPRPQQPAGPSGTSDLPPPLEARPRRPDPSATPRLDLGHVEVGQRWEFAGGSVQQVWTVDAVEGDVVYYSLQLYMDGTPVGEPSQEVWTSEEADAAERLERAAGLRRDALVVDDLRFECRVAEVGDVITWRPERSGQITFPGVVRYQRGGTVVWELVGVE